MAEMQISPDNIKVVKERLSHWDTGGAYRVLSLEVHVDTSLPKDRQRKSAAYEVLGSYLGAVVSPETLEEIADRLCDVLAEL